MRVDIIGSIKSFTDMIRILIGNDSFIVTNVNIENYKEMKITGYYPTTTAPEQKVIIESTIQISEYGVPLDMRTMKMGNKS